MILLVLDPAATEGQDLALLGVLFALVAALCQAGYALVSARGFPSVPAFQAATIQRGWSLLILLMTLVPVVLLLGDAPRLVGPLDGVDAWLLVIVAGVFSAGLPAAGLVAGYRRVGPTRGAVLMLLEPLTGVLLAAWFLAEQPTPLQLLGGLLVLIGAIVVQQSRSGRAPAPAEPSAE
jgi:drug/metabolite transporter (DMT)-like permease